jgi:uncharacterized membrane protein YbhN (UPF0104 family)
VRLLGGALLLAVLLWRLGPGPFLAGLRGLDPGTVLAAAAIGAVTTLCSAWRWRVVAAALGTDLPLRGATAAYYRSQFLNSTLPGGVLGDVDRAVRHRTAAGGLGRAVRAVVWERGAGQVVQAGIGLGVLLGLPSPVQGVMPVVASGAVLALCLLGVAAHGPLRRIAADARLALLQPATWPAVLLASLLVVGGHVGTFLLAAHAAGVTAPPAQVLPLALVVLLAAGLPLNVGGWGPREGAAAWVFAAAGWGAGTGAAVATAFGVLTLAAVLPGVVVLLVDGLRPRSRSPHPGPVPDGVVPGGVREDGAVHG